jgi:peptidoglycan/LPS O-acetylase OafA/YrhL
MKLSDYATGRDNNFNLVRFVAAFSVLYSHSYALVLGIGNFEPFVTRIGYTLAGIAVDVFFITSGFLVTASMLRLGAFKPFFRARALRIFPALVVMSVLLAFILGPLFTTQSVGDYFSDAGTYKFVLKNSTILAGIKLKLPGVFETLPFVDTNGSLWTLPFEVRCYLMVALLWFIALGMRVPGRAFAWLAAALATMMLLAFWATHDAGYKHWHTFRLFYMFFAGATFWTLRDRIPMRHSLAAGMGLALAAAVIFPRAFFWVYPLAIPYLVLYVAYVPGGWIRGFNRFGDYSYGIYIYAFPVQQVLKSTVPGITPAQMIMAATALTLPLAMLSWHLVEKPMLARKDAGARKTTHDPRVDGAAAQ